MADSDTDKIERKLPLRVQKWLQYLRRPENKFLRITAGILLIIFGFLGFLPILGFWMIPLGLLLLAEDYPPAQKLVRKMMVIVQRWWSRRPQWLGGRRNRTTK